MKLYSEMLRNTHDLISGRERLEWSNFWYDDTNKEVEHRILLVGDSTARMVRSTFAEKSGYAVDLCGISSGLHDIFFAKQMDCFFSSNKYKYDAIFVQLGHHSRIGEMGKPYNEDDYKRFEEDYNILLDYLLQFSPKIILLTIFYSVIPFTKFKDHKIIDKVATLMRRFVPEKYDDEINDVKQRKNNIILRIAESRNILFCDINQIMLDRAGNYRTVCLHTDHVHFEDKAKDVIVKQYMDYVRRDTL